MSHEIVKSLSLKDETKEVFITSASNNVYPKDFARRNSEYLHDLWVKEGKEAVEKYLLSSYAGGMMRGGGNKYESSSKLAYKQEPFKTMLDDIRNKENKLDDVYYSWKEKNPSLKYDDWIRSETCEDFEKAMQDLNNQRKKIYYDAFNQYESESIKDYIVKVGENFVLDKKARSIETTGNKDIAKVFRKRKSDIEDLFKGYSSYDIEIIEK